MALAGARLTVPLPFNREVAKEMAPAIQLSEAVHAVRVDGSFVLLDIRKDRYLFLRADQSEWLGEILSHAGEAGDLPAQAKRFADSLRARNLMSGDFPTLPPAGTTPPLSPSDSWLGSDSGTSSAVDPLHVIRMFRAVATCWCLERSRNFAGVVAEVSRWKSRSTRMKAPSDTAVLAELAAFRRLTPFFFTSHEACRFRSLVLLKFLTGAGVAPDWVFAVRLAPFAAHCWIEWDGHVLNEHFGRTQDYSEIMRV